MSASDTKYHTPRFFGYTLIEILVSLTIIGMLFGFGYVNFRDFSRRQALASVAKILQGDLRLAQQQALSGKRPESGCGTSNGIAFKVVSPTEYVVEYVCDGASVTPPIKSVVLPDGITITYTQPSILFKVLGRGNTVPATPAQITFTQEGTNSTVRVEVTREGQIR